MPTADTISRSSIVRVLVFGKFKLGKTAGAATFPRPNFLSFDQGMNTIGSPWFKKTFPQVDITKVRYQDFYERDVAANGVPRSHNAFDDATTYYDACMEGKPWKSPYDGITYTTAPEDFDTWVVDSGTTLGTAATWKAVILLGDPAFAGRSLSRTYKAATEKGLLVPKQQDFGAERSLVEQFIRMVYNSGKHVVVLCHEKELSTDDGTITDIVPLFTGQSVERIPIMFDEVYRLEATKSGPNLVRTLRTSTNGIIKCGTRLGVPDGTLWNWDALSKAIKG